MGYYTYFTGSLEFDRELEDELRNYLEDFLCRRHMKRDKEKIKELYPDWKERCYKGELGEDGEFFICNNDETLDILEYNYPPSDVPGLWCDWDISSDSLFWNGNETFYNYVDWLEYLIEKFFRPEGYLLNGTINFCVEDKEDFGRIIVENNKVTVEHGICVMSFDEIDTKDLIKELENRGYSVKLV